VKIHSALLTLDINLAGGSGDRWSWLPGHEKRARHHGVALGVRLGV